MSQGLEIKELYQFCLRENLDILEPPKIHRTEQILLRDLPLVTNESYTSIRRLSLIARSMYRKSHLKRVKYFLQVAIKGRGMSKYVNTLSTNNKRCVQD